MATIKSEYYRLNGSTWDKYYFKTTADMIEGLTWSHISGKPSTLSTGTSGTLRVTSGGGYIDVGAQNNYFAHIYTDRPSFYFNKDISINGQKVATEAYASDTFVKKESLLGRTTAVGISLAAGDINKIIRTTNTGPIDITIPNTDTLPIGSEIYISRFGTGEVKIRPATGLTIRASGGKLRISNVYDMVAVIRVSATEWVLVGSIKS